LNPSSCGGAIREHELVAEEAPDFEFRQLMRAFRRGIISEATVEEVMSDLEKRSAIQWHEVVTRTEDLPD
jgi:hypothetical protein